MQVQGERELLGGRLQFQVTMDNTSDHQSGSCSSEQHVKLWVGNLPHKLTEFQLLKILEKFGDVSQFDFLYNINDAGKRIPRGYCFVTFSSAVSAENAIKKLNKTEILGREILVRLANPKTDPVLPGNRKIIPAALKAGGTTKSLSDSEKMSKIKQLEEKLKILEKSSANELKITSSSHSCKPKTKPYSKPQTKK